MKKCLLMDGCILFNIILLFFYIFQVLIVRFHMKLHIAHNNIFFIIITTQNQNISLEIFSLFKNKINIYNFLSKSKEFAFTTS